MLANSWIDGTDHYFSVYIGNKTETLTYAYYRIRFLEKYQYYAGDYRNILNNDHFDDSYGADVKVDISSLIFENGWVTLVMKNFVPVKEGWLKFRGSSGNNRFADFDVTFPFDAYDDHNILDDSWKDDLIPSETWDNDLGAWVQDSDSMMDDYLNSLTGDMNDSQMHGLIAKPGLLPTDTDILFYDNEGAVHREVTAQIILGDEIVGYAYGRRVKNLSIMRSSTSDLVSKRVTGLLFKKFYWVKSLPSGETYRFRFTSQPFNGSSTTVDEEVVLSSSSSSTVHQDKTLSSLFKIVDR